MTDRHKKTGKLVRADPEQWARYEKAAHKTSPLGLNNWILAALDSAADQDLTTTEQKIRKAHQ